MFYKFCKFHDVSFLVIHCGDYSLLFQNKTSGRFSNFSYLPLLQFSIIVYTTSKLSSTTFRLSHSDTNEPPASGSFFYFTLAGFLSRGYTLIYQKEVGDLNSKKGYKMSNDSTPQNQTKLVSIQAKNIVGMRFHYFKCDAYIGAYVTTDRWLILCPRIPYFNEITLAHIDTFYYEPMHYRNIPDFTDWVKPRKIRGIMRLYTPNDFGLACGLVDYTANLKAVK